MSLIRINSKTPAVCAALPLIFALFCSTVVAKEIYQWTDEDGVPHFADLPPSGYPSQSLLIPDIEEPDAPAEPESSPATAAPQPVTRTLCDQHQDRLDKMLATRNVRAIDENGEARPLRDVEYRSLIKQSTDYVADNCD